MLGIETNETKRIHSFNGRHFGIIKNIAMNYPCVPVKRVFFFLIFILEVGFLGPNASNFSRYCKKLST